MAGLERSETMTEKESLASRVAAFGLAACVFQAFSGPPGIDHLRRGIARPCHRKSCTGPTLAQNPVTRDAKESRKGQDSGCFQRSPSFFPNALRAFGKNNARRREMPEKQAFSSFF